MTCDSEETRGIKRKLTKRCIEDAINTNRGGAGSEDRVVQNRTTDRSEAKRVRKMEIETEFRILKSLIPNIANKQQINELEIIDACVSYIEALQDQLNIRNSPTSAGAGASAATTNDLSEEAEVDSVGDELEDMDEDGVHENDENAGVAGRLQPCPRARGPSAPRPSWFATSAAARAASESDQSDDSDDEVSDTENEEENNNSDTKKLAAASVAAVTATPSKTDDPAAPEVTPVAPQSAKSETEGEKQKRKALQESATHKPGSNCSS